MYDMRRRVYLAKHLNKGKEAFCCYCNMHLHMEEITLEHLIPLSHNGTNYKSNIKPCCKACNQWRGNQSYEDWEVEIKELVNTHTNHFLYQRLYSNHDLRLMLKNINKWKYHIKKIKKLKPEDKEPIDITIIHNRLAQIEKKLNKIQES